ncbi:hypothetical protein ACULNC_21965 [Shigella flexneri]
MSELNEKLATAWEGFTKGDWQNEVNVRDFIQKSHTPYEGDESFLAGATEATTTLWDKVMEGVNRKTALTRQLILTPLLLPPSPLTTLATSIKRWKKLLVCRLKLR